MTNFTNANDAARTRTLSRQGSSHGQGGTFFRALSSQGLIVLSQPHYTANTIEGLTGTTQFQPYRLMPDPTFPFRHASPNCEASLSW